MADELAALEADLAAGSIDWPAEPTGRVLLGARGPEATMSVSITYQAGSCTFVGPDRVDAGTVIEVVLDNRSDEQAFIGLIPLTHDMTLEEVSALRSDNGSPPEELMIWESVGRVIDAGAAGSVMTPPMTAATYAVFCTGSVPVAAAVVRVG